ncbi:MAG: metalloprotease TldD [Pseudomonadota bacterium]
MSQEIIHRVTDSLLTSSGLSLQDIDRVFSKIMCSNVDYADLYFQSVYHESWYLEEGIVKEGSYAYDQGVGIRVVSGEKTGYAYSDDLVLPALEDAAIAARSINRLGNATQAIKAWNRGSTPIMYSHNNPLDSMTSQQKVDLLNKADQLARAASPKVTQVMASLSSSYEQVLIFNHDGSCHADIRPLVRFNIQVLAEFGDKREGGSCGGGLRGDYAHFSDVLIQEFVNKAVKQALTNLEAIPAPAGLMPVVLGSGWPGVLLHEAIGHGLEGDFIRKKTSAFTDKLGQRVASDKCTIVDDATLLNRRGSVAIDDEGTVGQNTMLIENGILRGFMQDKLNARLMGVAATGNGRRESYAHIPMPRMTNTYMLPGDDDPADIIKSVKKGIYAVNFGGGEVDITSGKFVFSASEAYLIEDGKVTAPIKGATLIGNGPDVLTKVTMVGNDLQLDPGVGVCGKDGQSVPVGVGQPTLKVSEMVVGGTQL